MINKFKSKLVRATLGAVLFALLSGGCSAEPRPEKLADISVKCYAGSSTPVFDSVVVVSNMYQDDGATVLTKKDGTELVFTTGCVFIKGKVYLDR